MLEVCRVVAENVGDKQAESARLIGRDIGRVVAQTDTEKSPTRARTAAVDIAVRGARAAVAVSGTTFVVVVAPHTNLELARSCDLDVRHIRNSAQWCNNHITRLHPSPGPHDVRAPSFFSF